MDERTGRPYVDNTIRSCRYTPLNFVPRQLWAQFGKLANFYFLCVSTLQMIPGLSTTGTYTTIIPLFIFVGISMAKEGYDDLRRSRLDKEENERMASVLNDAGSSCSTTKASEPVTSSEDDECLWRTEKWQTIRVGDVVLLSRDDTVAAALILRQEEDEDGTAFVETQESPRRDQATLSQRSGDSHLTSGIRGRRPESRSLQIRRTGISRGQSSAFDQ